MDLLIREVRPGDAEAILRILNPIIEAGVYTALDTPVTVDAERDFIANFPERGIFHVAERGQDQKLVAFQTIEPYGTYTHAFDHVGVMGTFVDLSQRQQGIGTRLSEVTFETARSKGYEKIFTYLRADNLAALAFYLQLGFRIVGTAQRQAKLGHRYVDEIIIEKLF